MKGQRQYIALAAIVFLAGARNAFAQADLLLTFVGEPNGGNGCAANDTCGGVTYPLAPGRQALYELIVSNNGPASASGVVETVTFPAKTSVDNPSSLSFFGCSSSIVSGSPTVTCTQASLPVGGSFGVAITITLANDYPWQDGLTATASVTSSTPDPVVSNNSVTNQLVVEAPAWIPALDPRALAVLIAVLALAGCVSLSRA